MTTTCKRCERPCVPARVPADLVPEGHKRFKAKGLCKSCYGKVQRERNQWPSRYKACVNPECGVMRKVTTSRAGSTGLCWTCWKASQRANPEDTEEFYLESEVELTGGEWVNVRGVRRWVKREGAAALPTPRGQRGTSRVQHGTDSGYHTHRRQTYGWPKEACQPCKQAHAAKQSETARAKREEAAA